MCRTPRALVIHHLRPRPDGAATRALAEAGYELDQRHPIEGDPLPHPDEGHAVAPRALYDQIEAILFASGATIRQEAGAARCGAPAFA